MMGNFLTRTMNAVDAAKGKKPRFGSLNVFGTNVPIDAIREASRAKEAAPKKEDAVKPAALPAKESSEKKEAKKKKPEKMADQMVNANQDRSYLKDTARRLVNITGQK